MKKTNENERHENFPNWVEALFMVILLVVLMYVISAALMDYRRFFHTDATGMFSAVSTLAHGIIFSFVLVYKRLSYKSLFQPGGQSAVAVLGVLGIPVILIAPALLAVVSAVFAVLLWFFPLPYVPYSHDFVTITSTCILAPMVEEMFFRGILLRSFLHQYSARNSILISSLLFGFAHMNIYQFVGASLGGVVMGWLYERSRSLWPGILLHAVYNACCVFIDQDIFEQTWVWGVVGICAFVGHYLLRRLLVRPARVV